MEPKPEAMSQTPEPVDSTPTTDPEKSNDPAIKRPGMSHLQWICALAIFSTMSAVSGYDVSNVANIQPRLYKEFGHIELLPWIGLSYSLANFGVLSYARKMTYCFNLKWIFMIHMIIFMVGTAVAGAAHNITAIIVGRVIMGWGGSVVQQSLYSYGALLATPAEQPGVFARLAAMWAVGLVIGGPIGSAFAENSSATWRWAFFVKLPVIGVSFVLAIFCLPSRSLAPEASFISRLTRIDPLGLMFNAAVPTLFALATTFSGPIWDWGSAPSIVVWVVFAVTLVAWFVQQAFCIFTTKEDRALPVHIFSTWKSIPIWLVSACAGAAYAVTLYYLPLFYAFARGHGSIQQTVRLLPFILPFIVTVLFTGAILPIVGRYKFIYLCAGILTLSGSAALAATLSENTSEAQVMGLESIIGIGLGMHWQHGMGILNVLNKTERDRVDNTVICNMMQMGAIAVSLSVAGCIFHNVGYNMLSDAIGSTSERYSEQDIREALAGVSSAVWQSRDPAVLSRGIHAVTEVISREFYLAVSSGALCLICAIFMSGEKLDYGRAKKSKKEAKKEASPPADADSA